MTLEDSQVRAGEAEVAAFAAKLDAWAQSLSPTDQALLGRLVTRAASADPEPEDTEGYIIIVGGLEQRGIIVVGGQPSPLFSQALGRRNLQFDSGGGVGRR